MLNLREIDYFVACVQNDSFSKAAEALFTTQSSVSKVIKAMEEEMGVQLFERQAKGICPTAEAEEMYIYAQAVLENMKKMESQNRKQ
jgi:DNA-binding transcriptional LysR family regulator